MSKIELIDLSVSYKNKKRNESDITALSHVSHVFDGDKIHIILGPSGCGKTTLLKTIIGLVDYDGTINVNDKDYDLLSVKDKNIGYVSQNYVLYPRLTVFDNIAFPLKNIGASRDEIMDRVFALANTLDLTPCLNRKPKDLSGGQQQRVALARALVKTPNIFFFDEPLSNVDPIVREQEARYIKKIIKTTNRMALYVTHNITEALLLADDIHVMDEQGFVFSGNVEEFLNSEFSKTYNLEEEAL